MLVGLPLTDMWHPLFHVFEFGEQKPFVNRAGRPSERADITFDIDGAWRLMRYEKVLIASDDYPSMFYEEEAQKTHRRELATIFRRRSTAALFDAMAANTLVVRSVTLTTTQVVTVTMDQSYTIEAIPCSGARFAEHWSLRTPEFTVNCIGNRFEIFP